MHNKRVKRRTAKVFMHDPWGIRGPGVYTHSLCYALSKVGLQISLFTNFYYEYEDFANYKVKRRFFRISEKMEPSLFRKAIRGVEYIVVMIHLLVTYTIEKPEVIHVQWFLFYYFDIIWIRIVRLLLPNTKLVLTAHNVLPHVNGMKYMNILSAIYSQFDTIIVHSETLKYQMLNVFGEKARTWNIKVINMGVQEELIKKANPEKADYYRGEINEEKYKGRAFLFIGDIHQYKGLDILIKAWDIHSKRYPNDILFIAGQPQYNIDEELSYIKNRLSRNVKLSLGYKSDKEVVSYYLSTDFVVLPYKEASQSGVLLTALTFGKPVIVTDVGALSETVKLVKGGYVIPPNDYVSLSEALDKASKVSDEVLKNWGKDIRAKAIENFSWDKIAKRILKLYKEGI